MSQDFHAGDFLVFQIESAFGLLRVLDVETSEGETIWHIAAYHEMFLDVETADAALKHFDTLSASIQHVALTNRAFYATQTSKMINAPLNDSDLEALEMWRTSDKREISDRSIRLLLGLR